MPRQHRKPLEDALAYSLTARIEACAYGVALLTALGASGEGLVERYVTVGLLSFVLAVSRPAEAPVYARVDFARAVCRWVTVVLLLLSLGMATAHIVLRDPGVLIAWLALAPVVAFLAERFVRHITAALSAGPPFSRKSVIVGAHAIGQQFSTKLTGLPGMKFCGFFDDRSKERLGLAQGERLRGALREVPLFSTSQKVDVVYVALPMISRPRVADLLAQLEETTVSIYFVPDVSVFGLTKPRLEKIADTPVICVCETPFLGFNGLLKRTEDLLLGTLLLFATLPAMLVIAVAIKLDSTGPLFFTQRRHGLDGREIVVYKFRTMKVLEDGPDIRQAQCGDPRITRVGAFLRRYSLDELPQLVNVLQGRMSLVGPRPHAVAHNELYRKVICGYMIRHKVRPGITGWAQVNGLRGETDSLEKMKARVEHDLAYLRGWSLTLDLAILLRTAWAVMRPRNAY
jgi:putative colanic acid biosysnthesis UDP-glucose lipid carrier transferase